MHPSQSPAESRHTHARVQPGSVDTDGLQSTVYGIVGDITTIDPDDAAAAGTSPRLAHADHQHAENVWPPGFVNPYVGTAAPTGWLMCDGASVLRADFAALFAVIGTAYGSVDGTHFNVPDLRQRFPLGKATSGTGATLGGTGGTIDHVHALDSATSHARIAMNDTTDQISSETKATANWTRNAGASLVTNNTGATDSIGARLGGNSDVANPPFQTFNWVIKT